MKVVGVNLFVATYIMTSSYKNNYFNPRTVKMQKIHSKFWDLIFLNHFLEKKCLHSATFNSKQLVVSFLHFLLNGLSSYNILTLINVC